MPKHTLKALKDFLVVSNQSRLLNYINYSEYISPVLESYGQFTANLKTAAKNAFSDLGYYPVGELCTKVEAAGKVRVFAMVDF